MAKKKNSFSGSLGFVLAAAGSAVGVGNIWRFPYLCAKDGGGLFLLVYLVLVACLTHASRAKHFKGSFRMEFEMTERRTGE